MKLKKAMRTQRNDKNGKEINVGDTLLHDDGVSAKVFQTKKGFRVAENELQANNGQSASLGLFLVGGAVIVEPEKPATDAK